MKSTHFLYVSFVCAALMLVACEKSPDLRISSRDIIIDAFQDEPVTIDISAGVEWTITVIHPDETWLSVSPLQGKGSATLILEADENPDFTERTAYIAISGNGVKTDTIMVIQLPDIDILAKITDEKFREYCLSEFDNDPKDGKISTREARSVFEIKAGRMQIKSLAGIEYFTKLERLNCRDNNIENLDLSENLALKILNCFNNSIKTLDLSNNVDLRYLDCSYNPITHIDVGGLEKLTDLFIHSADLTNIDVKNNTRLIWLAVSNNKISNIDVSNNKELQGLECNENGLTDVIVSGNPQLRTLYCGNNKLSKLKLENNPALTQLYCNNNELDELDLSKNAALQSLNCSNNKFRDIILHCPNLTELYCSGNSISRLNLSNLADLKQLHCDGNTLIDIDLSKNLKLEGFRCSNNKLLNEIDLSKNNKLTYIDLTSNSTSLKVLVWQGFFCNPDYKKDKIAGIDKDGKSYNYSDWVSHDGRIIECR